MSLSFLVLIFSAFFSFSILADTFSILNRGTYFQVLTEVDYSPRMSYSSVVFLSFFLRGSVLYSFGVILLMACYMFSRSSS